MAEDIHIRFVEEVIKVDLAEGVKGDIGDAGDDGREIELQKTDTYVQWRYVGESSWINLIAIVDLKGATGDQGIPGTNGADGNDGREIELQKGLTYIQWRYIGDTEWINLILISELKGDPGTTEWDGLSGKPESSPEDIDSAVSLKHTQDTDTKLKNGILEINEDNEIVFNGVDSIKGVSKVGEESGESIKYLNIGKPSTGGFIRLFKTIPGGTLDNNGTVEIQADYSENDTDPRIRFWVYDGEENIDNILLMALYKNGKLQVPGFIFVDGRIKVGTDIILVGNLKDGNGENGTTPAELKSAVNNSHALESDNQIASEVPTKESGVSVQDRLDELHLNYDLEDAVLELTDCNAFVPDCNETKQLGFPDRRWYLIHTRGLCDVNEDTTLTVDIRDAVLKKHEQHSDDQDLSGLVEKVAGSSLVADTEIAKIHVSGSDDQIASEVPTDESGISVQDKLDELDSEIEKLDTLITDNDATTITFDLSLSKKHQVIIADNRILALSNVSVGQVFLIRITQGTGGSHTVTWFNTIKWAEGGTPPTLTVTEGKADVFGFLCTSEGQFDGFVIGQNIG